LEGYYVDKFYKASYSPTFDIFGQRRQRAKSLLQYSKASRTIKAGELWRDIMQFFRNGRICHTVRPNMRLDGALSESRSTAAKLPSAEKVAP